MIDAVREGKLERVKHLVEQGACVHSRNNFGLRWAIHNKHVDVMKYLVEQGADVDDIYEN